jgi:hypothetical protein
VTSPQEAAHRARSSASAPKPTAAKAAKRGEALVAVVVLPVGVDVDPAMLLAWTSERVGQPQRRAGIAARADRPRHPNSMVLKRELRRGFLERSHP